MIDGKWIIINCKEIQYKGKHVLWEMEDGK
jgi:hypothetical protein